MWVLDWLLVPLMVLPPWLLFAIGSRRLRRGAANTQIQALVGGFAVAPILVILYVLGSDLPERLAHLLGIPMVGLAVIWWPMSALQLGLGYAAFLLDSRARDTDWTFLDFMRGTQRLVVVQIAFMAPFSLGIPLVEPLMRLYPPLWEYIDNHVWAALTLTLAIFAASGWSGWWAWRWTALRCDPVPPDVAARLERFSAQTGYPVRRLALLRTGGGRVANAYVMGFRAGRYQVLLTDFLVERFPAEEIEAIYAHELGHIALGHLSFRLWLSVAILVIMPALLLGWAYLAFWILHWHPVPAFLMVMPLLLALPLVTGPLLRKQELAADQWAAQATARPEVLAAALQRLEDLNRMHTAALPRWMRWLFPHPLTPRRLAALRSS